MLKQTAVVATKLNLLIFFVFVSIHFDQLDFFAIHWQLNINIGKMLMLHTSEQMSCRRDIMVEVHVLVLAASLRYGRESSL